MKTHERTDVLSLENFWNKLYEKYPEAAEEWCDWIDQYKDETNLKVLFNERIIKAPVNGFDDLEIIAPKVHQLPIALQVGIFMQFLSERVTYSTFNVRGDWKAQVEKYFECRQLEIDTIQD
jgi:hypothetical protein